METYRNFKYTIQWVEGIAHFTLYIKNQIIRGEGNHGVVKERIDRIIKLFY